MSRVGKRPIKIADKVRVRLESKTVYVEGPKGKHVLEIPSAIDVEVSDKEIIVKRRDNERKNIALHGMVRAIINNMVVGVSNGFSKILDIVGVGYKAESKGKELVISVGYSKPVVYTLPQGIEAKVDKQTRITISGSDKKVVGEVAAEIRRIRLPEPYKGKGIRYAGEIVKHKVGKAAITTGA